MNSPHPLPRSAAIFAILLYLATAAVWLHVVWESPTTILPTTVTKAGNPDQSMVLATITDNARRLLHRPGSFFDSGACHPLPRSYTLGEHMFGNGLLFALPLALTGEPVLSYNLLLLMLASLAGLAMFAFTWFLTRSVPAALVAGLLFELFVPRLRDPTHPFIYADFWTILALLFLARLFVRGGWRNAVGVATFGTLQLGESLYAVLTGFVLLAIVGTSLAIRYRSSLVRRLPQLLACAAVAALAAWVVFAPYLETARVWGTLEGRTPWLILPPQLALGRGYFPGMLLVGLASIGPLDRVRGPRTGGDGDLRLALTVAGVLLAWLSVAFIPVPFTQWRIPSPTPLLWNVVPGLSAVRVPATLIQGLSIALSVLAAYGVLAVVERFSRRTGFAITLVLLAVVLAEVYDPALARRSFGFSSLTQPLDVSLPRADLGILRSLGGATVLEYPPMDGNLLAHAHFLRTAVEHGGRTSACYNSFGSPLGTDVARLALQLPEPAAAEALGALGFEVVLVHLDKMPDALAAGFFGKLAASRSSGGRLNAIAGTRNHVAFRLRPTSTVVEDWALLGPPVRPDPRQNLEGPTPRVRFRFHNATADTFRHPGGVAPRPLLLRWVDAAGEPIGATEIDGRLPLAVGPGGTVEMTYTLPSVPTPGDYDLLLSLRERPDEILARSPVRVAGVRSSGGGRAAPHTPA